MMGDPYMPQPQQPPGGAKDRPQSSHEPTDPPPQPRESGSPSCPPTHSFAELSADAPINTSRPFFQRTETDSDGNSFVHQQGHVGQTSFNHRFVPIREGEPDYEAQQNHEAWMEYIWENDSEIGGAPQFGDDDVPAFNLSVPASRSLSQASSVTEMSADGEGAPEP